MSKKVLILGNSDAGLFEFRKEVVTALIDEGIEVHISVPDTGYIDRISELGAIMHPTKVDRRGMNPVADFRLYRTYRKLIRAIQPASVLTYTIKPNVYGGMAAASFRGRRNKTSGDNAGSMESGTETSGDNAKKVRVLANVTGLGSSLQGKGMVAKFVKFLYRKGLRHASVVFCQNETNLEFLKATGIIPLTAETVLLPGSGVNLEKHQYLEYPNSVPRHSEPSNSKLTNFEDMVMDAESIHASEKRRNAEITRFLYVGRIMDDKGSSELLTAIEEVFKTYPYVKLDIIGSYEEETREKYESWVERLSTKGIVEFHGFRDDVDTFYGKCHALIHPSYHEGMSNVVLEAAASGRPVLTSDIPGCREGYESGVGGIAFEPKSSEAITEAMLIFLSFEPEKRREMGMSARKFVEKHFDRKIVIDAYLKRI